MTDEHTKQFLEAYGQAMLSWQAVEFRLVLLFLTAPACAESREAVVARPGLTADRDYRRGTEPSRA